MTNNQLAVITIIENLRSMLLLLADETKKLEAILRKEAIKTSTNQK